MQENAKIEVDKLCLDGRKHLSMTGVEAVDSFSDSALKLTVSGSKVVIEGENIKIISYNKSVGNLQAEGHFNEFKYSYKKAPIVKRLFK